MPCRLFLLLAVIMVVAIPVNSALAVGAEPLPEPLRQLAAGPVVPILNLGELDPGTRAALERKTGPGLADAKASFSAGCTPDRGQAMQRFVLAGRVGPWCFVEYEYGGIAHGMTLLVFKPHGNTATMAYDVAMPSFPRTLPAIQTALRDGKFTIHDLAR